MAAGITQNMAVTLGKGGGRYTGKYDDDDYFNYSDHHHITLEGDVIIGTSSSFFCSILGIEYRSGNQIILV